jgi:ParB/RepB/Spo0J family partition protein
VSEFEPRSVVPPVVPAIRPEAFHDDDFDSPEFTGETGFGREGLPPGFRMRHDAHYVEQLTGRIAAPHVRLIPLRDIESPRLEDTADLDGLVRSIQAHGVLQPILVRPRGGRFDLITGRKRLAAAHSAGLGEIPCLVHHADDVRARELADADNVRIEASAAPASAAAQDAAHDGLRELGKSFSTIASCLNLLGDRDQALRDRVALDLIRTEIHRAERLVQSLDALGQDPPLAQTAVSLAAVVDRALEGFAAERRLSGVSVQVEMADGPMVVRGDQDWLTVGLSGAIGGMLALVQGATAPALTVSLTASASRSSIVVEIAQHTVTVPTWGLSQFFDVAWIDRPGGYQAAAELAAAKKVVTLHRGGIEVLPGDRGGCRLVLVLPEFRT